MMKYSRGDRGTVDQKSFIQYISDPLRATGIFQSTNDNTLDGLSNSDA